MTEDNTDKTEVGLGMNKIIGEVTCRGNVRSYDRENSRGEYRNSYRIDSYDRSRNRSRETDHFPEIIATMQEIEAQAIAGPGQDKDQVQIGIEFDIISVGNIIILQGTVPLLGVKSK